MHKKQLKKLALATLCLFFLNIALVPPVRGFAVVISQALIHLTTAATNAICMLCAATTTQFSTVQTQLAQQAATPLSTAHQQTAYVEIQPVIPTTVPHQHTQFSVESSAPPSKKLTPTKNSSSSSVASASTNSKVAEITQKAIDSISTDQTNGIAYQYRFVTLPYSEKTTTVTHMHSPGKMETRYDFPNNASISFTVSRHPDARTQAIYKYAAAQRARAYAIRKTLTRINADPAYAQDVIHRLNKVFECLQRTCSLDAIESAAARLELHTITMEEPFQSHIEYATHHIQKHCFNRRGELISLDKRSYIEPYIKDLYTDIAQYFNHPENLLKAPRLLYLEHPGRIDSVFNEAKIFFSGPSAFNQTIANNRTNQAIVECLRAGFKGDVYTVKQLANQHTNTIITKLERTFTDHYLDANGIYKACAQDPLYRAMTTDELRGLYRNPIAQKELNNALLLRKGIKDAFHTAWNIPQTASQSVHDALYTIIDAQSKPVASIPAMIDTVVHISQGKPELIQAFFLPNGVMKDFTHYPRAATLKLHDSIFSTQHTPDLLRLNHLLYIEQAMPDIAAGQHATRCIDYLSAHINAPSDELKESYGALYRAYYSLVAGKASPIICELPNLAITYTDPTQQLVHEKIVHAAALLIEAPFATTIPIEPTLYHNYLDHILVAHDKNIQGFPDFASFVIDELNKQIYTPIETQLDQNRLTQHPFCQAALQELIKACAIILPSYTRYTPETPYIVLNENEQHDAADNQPFQDEIQNVEMVPPSPEQTPDDEKDKEKEYETDNVWDMPEHPKTINGRKYSQHALERMAPDTIENRAKLIQRALDLGYEVGSNDFKNYVNPRGIPPSIVEDVIKNAIPQPGSSPATLEYILDGVTVITNLAGDVISTW